MIKKHVCNNLIKSMNSDALLSAFQQAVMLSENVREILKACKGYVDGEVDEDTMLDTVDDYYAVNINEFSTFSACHCSTINAINSYLVKTLERWNEVYARLAKISNSCILPDLDSVKSLCDDLRQVIAGCTYFLMHEFGLFGLMKGDSSEMDIDEIYKAYLDRKCTPLDESLTYFCLIYEKFKMRLEIFDEYPEKEELFELLIGPYYAEVNSDNLTIEIVDGLLNGDLTPEDVCAMTNAEENNG